MNAMKTLITACSCMLAGLGLSITANAAVSNPTIVPAPKQIEWTGDTIALSQGSTAIVLGDKAVEPEQYAAEMLQKDVFERFKQNWPVVRESAGFKNYKNVILLGQQDTSKSIAIFTRKWKVDPGRKSLVSDSYVIRMGEADGQNIVYVGGSNPRGVVYGQDTLFQMIRPGKDAPELVSANIKDWPSIPWRGRPHIFVASYLKPGRLDAFMRGRINWIDLRDGENGSSGQYGYAPGCKINVDQVKEAVKEAHRRGLFIYATVDCAVATKEFDAVIKTFEELIALGADGLYISIDDPGADFRAGTSSELIRRVLDLGRKHGMTGQKIGFVPGKESYKEIITDTNKRVAKIPGMDEALWYWTVTPSAQALAEARSIGLKTKPAWWHNWPRPDGGITYNPGGTIRRKGGFPYREPMTLAEGWGKASYYELAKAGQYLDGIMPWGGSAWGAEYNAGALGWWAWDPELHDWQAVRARLYDMVFGPDQVKLMFDYDNTLMELRDLFVLPGSGFSSSGAPAYLKSAGDSKKALQLIDHMRQVYAKIKQDTPAQTLIDERALNANYLEPMSTVMDIATTIINTPFPEYWWPAHEARVLKAVRSGNPEQAALWDEQAKARMKQEVDVVYKTFSNMLQGLDDYVTWWKSQYVAPVTIPKVAQAPALKGDLSDPVWQQAVVITDLKLPGGAAPVDKTVAKLVYTDTDLYLGFVCHESAMDNLKVRFKQRDSEVYMDDSIEMFFNPDSLGETVYQLISNVDGYQADGRKTAETKSESNWSGNWDVKIVKAADKWTMEVKVPFKTIGVDSCPTGQMWLCNFARNDHAGVYSNMETDNAGESSCWSGSGNFHDSSAYKSVRFGK